MCLSSLKQKGEKGEVTEKDGFTCLKQWKDDGVEVYDQRERSMHGRRNAANGKCPLGKAPTSKLDSRKSTQEQQAFVQGVIE